MFGFLGRKGHQLRQTMAILNILTVVVADMLLVESPGDISDGQKDGHWFV